MTKITQWGSGVGLLLAGALSACSPTTVVVSGAKVPDVHVITVSGRGHVNVAPDIARLNIGVEVRNRNVQVAMAEASRRMTNLVATLERLGIAKKDIQTSALQMMLEPPMPPMPYGYPSSETPAMPPPGAETPSLPAPPPPDASPSMAMPSEPGKTGFYLVSSMVEVTLRELGRVGEVITQLTSAGANQAWGVSYDVEEHGPVLAQARAKAVQDAKARAGHLATLGEVKLGKVLAIREGGTPEVPMFGGYAPPMPQMASGMPGMPGMPVEPGRVRIEQWVTMVYALE